MDEFDDLTEEELKLASEFAQALENSETENESDALQSLKGTVALLESSDRWELSQTARERGRTEVERWASSPVHRSSKSERQAARWLFWLPLPSFAVVALVFWLSPSGETKEFASSANPNLEQVSPHGPKHGEEEERLDGSTSSPRSAPRDSEEGFEKVEPRYHAGQLSPRLLEAQAAVLSTRQPGEAKKLARKAFEREMRAYRGQLIASLEVGGR